MNKFRTKNKGFNAGNIIVAAMKGTLMLKNTPKHFHWLLRSPLRKEKEMICICDF